MKALKRNNMKPYLAEIILVLLLMISPITASANPDEEGRVKVIEKTMSQAIEAINAELDSELMVEEWMTQTFEVVNAEIDNELVLEEWMTQPFEVVNAEIDDELVLEEWMTRVWE